MSCSLRSRIRGRWWAAPRTGRCPHHERGRRCAGPRPIPGQQPLQLVQGELDAAALAARQKHVEPDLRPVLQPLDMGRGHCQGARAGICRHTSPEGTTAGCRAAPGARAAELDALAGSSRPPSSSSSAVTSPSRGLPAMPVWFARPCGSGWGSSPAAYDRGPFLPDAGCGGCRQVAWVGRAHRVRPPQGCRAVQAVAWVVPGWVSEGAALGAGRRRS